MVTLDFGGTANTLFVEGAWGSWWVVRPSGSPVRAGGVRRSALRLVLLLLMVILLFSGLT